MKLYSKLILGAFLLSVGFTAGLQFQRSRKEVRDYKVFARYLSDEHQKKLITMAPWLPNAEVFQVGPYFVFAEKMKDNLVVLADNQNATTVFIESGSVQLGVSRWFVNAEDKDNDGVYDSLTYDIVDSQGEPTGMVVDSNMDGFLDVKTIFGEGKNKWKGHTTSIRVSESWFPLEKRGDVLGVLDNGIWREVRKVGTIGSYFEFAQTQDKP